MTVRAAYVPLALAIALTACSHGGPQSSASPAATNPIAFPLYQGSTVLSTRDWSAEVREAQSTDRAFFPGGEGRYGGHEVIAETGATMGALEAWLQSLGSTPPQGYALAGSSGLEQARQRMQGLGLDFRVFERGMGAQRHALVVLAIDPQIFRQRTGPVLPLIERYRSLAKFLRAPIDAQAKAQLGFTVTQALDPATPLGAAIAAIGTLKSANERGIVLVDAVKQ
jgi:hypothetical protein